MLYSEILALAQTTLDDTNTGSGMGAVSWLRLINAANRDVWRQIVEANPSYFLTHGDITWPASTEKVTISGSGYLNTRPYKILEVDVTASSGDPSPSNRARKLRTMEFAERHDFIPASYSSSNVNGPSAYCYEGSGIMYVAPILSSAAFLRIFYVAPLADMTAASEDQPLGGMAHEFHDCVAYRAAVLANAKRGGTAGLAEQLWLEAAERIDRFVPNRQLDEPRRVRIVRRG